MSYKALKKKKDVPLISKIIKGKKVHAVVFCLYEIKEQAKTKKVIAEW